MIHKGTPTLSNQNKFCKILSPYLRKKGNKIYLFKHLPFISLGVLCTLVGALNVKSDLWVLNLFSLCIFKTSLYLEKAEPGLRWISWLKNSLSPDLQDITETLTFRLNQPRMPAVNKHVQQDGSRFGEFLRPTSTRTSHLCLRLSSNLSATYFGLNNTCGK